MKTKFRLAALLLCAVMMFGFTGCDTPVSEPVKFTVTFETNGGSEVAQITIEDGKVVVKPEDPSRAATAEAAYTFEGWYLDQELTTAFDFDSIITSDITLYAKWTVTALYGATISTLTNGTITADKTSGVKAGETVTLTVTPANGYKLSSLSVKSGDKEITVTNNSFTMPEGAVTISATFVAEVQQTAQTTTPTTQPEQTPTPTPTPEPTPTPTTYTVTFNSNGGSTVTSQTITSGNKATKPTDPTKTSTATTNYTFAGWYTSTDGGTTLSSTAFDFINTPITAAITLYAKWNITNLYSVTIAGTTNGTVSANKTSGIKAGETITLTVSPTDGYQLDSLSVKKGSEDVTVTNNTFTMPSGNVTVSVTFKSIYIGTKAPNAAKAVGDIVFTDGSASPYSENLTLTDAQKMAAVAVIFYAGTGEATVGSNVNILGQKTLGVGLHNTQGETTKTYVWAPENTTGNTTQFNNIQLGQYFGEPSDGNIYYQEVSTSTINQYMTGDFDGSDNWNEICTQDAAGTTSENVAANYPAFNWVNNYASANSLTGVYASGWYLPTGLELTIMHDNRVTVNAAIEKAGGTAVYCTTVVGNRPVGYWSSSQHYYSSNKKNAFCKQFNDDNSIGLYNGKKQDAHAVCAVREFN